MITPEPILVQVVEPNRDWFDYASLLADFAGAIVTAFFGVWILKITKRIEHSQWRNQKVIEKRIAVWDEVAPRINDIYCYSMRVGRWKDVSPREVVEWKREVDKKVHTFASYFSPAFFGCFMAFMNECFATFQGSGVDAKLRTRLQGHKSAHKNWLPEWDALFAESAADEMSIKAKYLKLQRQISAELSVE